MLDDSRSQRFIKDYAGQAYRLYELKANTPDKGLFPEYDDRLGQAIERETELFLAELISKNHGVGKLIDADFTFVNRRLADHYGIKSVEGQEMRRVTLPGDSLRGGLLTQASVHKITANGTTTSPVRPGQFRARQSSGKTSPRPRRASATSSQTRGEDDDSATTGGAPQQPAVRELPQGDRSARICARVVRPDRRLSDSLPSLRRRDQVW